MCNGAICNGAPDEDGMSYYAPSPSMHDIDRSVAALLTGNLDEVIADAWETYDVSHPKITLYGASWVGGDYGDEPDPDDTPHGVICEIDAGRHGVSSGMCRSYESALGTALAKYNTRAFDDAVETVEDNRASDAEYERETPVDRAIMHTRRAVHAIRSAVSARAGVYGPHDRDVDAEMRVLADVSSTLVKAIRVLHAIEPGERS